MHICTSNVGMGFFHQTGPPSNWYPASGTSPLAILHGRFAFEPESRWGPCRPRWPWPFGPCPKPKPLQPCWHCVKQCVAWVPWPKWSWGKVDSGRVRRFKASFAGEKMLRWNPEIRRASPRVGWIMIYTIGWLLVWNMNLIFIYVPFHINGMSSQPHWRTPWFFKMVIAPPTRYIIH